METVFDIYLHQTQQKFLKVFFHKDIILLTVHTCPMRVQRRNALHVIWRMVEALETVAYQKLSYDFSFFRGLDGRIALYSSGRW